MDDTGIVPSPISFDGDLYSLTTSDGILGVTKVIQGDISAGIRWLEGAISKRESEGYLAAANWYRLFLGELYYKLSLGIKGATLGLAERIFQFFSR